MRILIAFAACSAIGAGVIAWAGTWQEEQAADVEPYILPGPGTPQPVVVGQEHYVWNPNRVAWDRYVRTPAGLQPFPVQQPQVNSVPVVQNPGP